MRVLRRPSLTTIAFSAAALLGCVYVAWLGFQVQSLGDYPRDYAPAMNALLGGHIGTFVTQLPSNGSGGSVLLRAPGAMLGKLVVGGQHAVFRFGALESMLVVGALALYLERVMRDAGRSALERAALLAVVVLAPAVLDAVLYGHPEEPLGAALCVGAVLLAAQERASLAGVVLGLALINKPWGILAVAPVLLAARSGWLRIALVGAGIAVLWEAAVYVVAPWHFGATLTNASSSIVAHPVDLWWPLAHLRTAPGVTPAYFPPAVVSAHARELAVLLTVPLAMPLMRRSRRSASQCLALLSLLFLVRCLLDPSNHVYYQVPCVIAVAGWEASAGRAPSAALAATAGFWLVFHTISGLGSLDLQFWSYLCVAAALSAALVPAATGWHARARPSLRKRRLSLA